MFFFFFLIINLTENHRDKFGLKLLCWKTLDSVLQYDSEILRIMWDCMSFIDEGDIVLI